MKIFYFLFVSFGEFSYVTVFMSKKKSRVILLGILTIVAIFHFIDIYNFNGILPLFFWVQPVVLLQVGKESSIMKKQGILFLIKA